MTKVRALKAHSYPLAFVNGVMPRQYNIGDFYEMEDKDVPIMAASGNVRRLEAVTRDLKPTYPKKYQRRDMKSE